MAGLGDTKIAAVLRAEDIGRARKFYSEVLGLEEEAIPVAQPTREAWFGTGAGPTVSIYERPGMPAPQNTTLMFGVSQDEFDAVVDDLRSRGVQFEDYDLPDIGLKTVDGVAEYEGGKVAWFKDTEDNILSVVSL